MTQPLASFLNNVAQITHVAAVATSNISIATLRSPPTIGVTVDGITVPSGQTILLTNQTDGRNGLFNVGDPYGNPMTVPDDNIIVVDGGNTAANSLTPACAQQAHTCAHVGRLLGRGVWWCDRGAANRWACGRWWRHSNADKRYITGPEHHWHQPRQPGQRHEHGSAAHTIPDIGLIGYAYVR